MFTIKDIPEKQRGIYKRAMRGRSKDAAIRAHCALCVGWEDVANAVRECTMPECPLYPYRLSARQRHLDRRKSGSVKRDLGQIADALDRKQASKVG